MTAQNLDQLVDEARNGEIVVLDDATWQSLQRDATLVREEDTFVCGSIRLFDFEGTPLIQETTDQKQMIMRAASSFEEADAFVSRRLELYERMWDTCGCRVRYFEP